jgi:D-proline reductase (dithiol) PrdB
VPVLARSFEEAGLSTVLVTPMPYWAEKIGTPRTLAIAFPFGHTLGRPGDKEQQRMVITEALTALQDAETPGTVVHSEQTWPQSTQEAIESWQPKEPSPIIAELAPQFREMLRQRRRSKK